MMASQVVLMFKKPFANAGNIRDIDSIPGLGRSSGEGNRNTLWYSCLENIMDSRTLWPMLCRVGKNWTQLKQLAHTNDVF